MSEVTKNVFVKHYAPKYMLVHKNVKVGKGPDSFIWFVSKINQVIYSSSPILLPSFKPSFKNAFWDILLTSLKCQNFQRAMTKKKSIFFFFLI